MVFDVYTMSLMIALFLCFFSKKTISELKKQVGDLIDIKKRHQIQQNEYAEKIDTENKGK